MLSYFFDIGYLLSYDLIVHKKNYIYCRMSVSFQQSVLPDLAGQEWKWRWHYAQLSYTFIKECGNAVREILYVLILIEFRFGRTKTKWAEPFQQLSPILRVC